jgi:hypothetical protein
MIRKTIFVLTITFLFSFANSCIFYGFEQEEYDMAYNYLSFESGAPCDFEDRINNSSYYSDPQISRNSFAVNVTLSDTNFSAFHQYVTVPGLGFSSIMAYSPSPPIYHPIHEVVDFQVLEISTGQEIDYKPYFVFNQNQDCYMIKPADKIIANHRYPTHAYTTFSFIHLAEIQVDSLQFAFRFELDDHTVLKDTTETFYFEAI